jgi:hypothetical protein
MQENAVACISWEIGPVHAGGACNAKGTAEDYSGKATARKFYSSLPYFFQKYRFAIVIENFRTPAKESHTLVVHRLHPPCAA